MISAHSFVEIQSLAEKLQKFIVFSMNLSYHPSASHTVIKVIFSLLQICHILRNLLDFVYTLRQNSKRFYSLSKAQIE